ncbi:MAG: MHS family MFS transporter [Alphaproteobacteria bacterium]|nr:MHS family MFS transporter [Alphaproteobacteria bacterium]
MATGGAGIWDGGHLKRVVLASLIGTTIEWYDFFLYNYAAALVFNRLFFPRFDPAIGTLLAFTTYALGFVARPVGGIVFGHFGDRIGRKRLLMVSLVLMGLSTTLIGFLPTYQQVGIWAPLALVALRLVQGFAVGGEWGGAVLLAAEHADARRRGFWASWPQAGVPAGNLIAVGVLALIAAVQSDAAFADWGWRVPFLLSLVLVAIGWWIRTSVAESPAFEAEAGEAPPKLPALDVLREQPRAMATGAGLRLGENISYYIITAYSVVYLTETQHLSRSSALNATLLGAAIHFVIIPLLGRLSDRVGRRPVYAFGGLGLAVFSFAFLPMLASGEMAVIVVAITVALILHGAMYGPQAAFITELFPTRYRYSGVSIAYQLTSILAGSLAPIVAIWLYQQTRSTLAVSAYVGLACAISGVTALLASETKGVELSQIR